jgi:hypothetical protein
LKSLEERHEQLSTKSKKEVESHEKSMEEMKVREQHLKALNKTLKEEVRKLQKVAGFATPSTRSNSQLNLQMGNLSHPSSSLASPENIIAEKPGLESKSSSSSSLVPSLPTSPTLTRATGGPSSTTPASSISTSIMTATTLPSSTASPAISSSVSSAPLSTLATVLGLGGGSSSSGSASTSPIKPLRPRSSVGMSPTGEGPLDLPYLRAVIVKFIEKKETRAQLLPVISILLNLSSEDAQRVMKAKV